MGRSRFAAAGDDVLADLVDQHHVAGQPRPNRVIDRGEILGDEGLDGFEGEVLWGFCQISGS